MTALTIGDLVGYIRADGTDFQRNLARSQLQMEGFRVGVDGRLRDIRGRFVDEAQVMGRALADSFSDAERAGTRITTVYSSVADAQSRTLRGRLQRIQAAGRRLGDQLQRVWARARRAFSELDFDGVGKLAVGFGRAVAPLAKVSALLGSVAPLAAGLAASVGQIAPAAGLAATALVAVVLTSQALKLGMVGVGDAVKAAMDPSDPEAFNEALKKLSPSAQAFAKQVKALQPEFKALQQDVQERLFKGLDGILKEMGKSTLPILRTGLTNTAGALNLMARNVGNTAIGLSKSGALGRAISGANTGLYNLSRIPSQIVQGITQVGAAAAPAFGRLTAAAGGAFDRLSERMTKAFHSGAIEQAIEQAISLIGEVVDVAKNIGSIVGSIFGAAQVSGGGFLAVLKEITGSLAEAFASKPVQAGLKALYETMAQVARSVGPILVSVLGTLGRVLAVLGPPVRELVKHLGEGLLRVADAARPAVVALAGAFGQLVTLAVPLVDLAADLLTAILPALTPLFATLAGVLKAAAPVVQQLASSLGALLLPILQALATEVLPKILPPLVDLAARIFPLLTDILVQLTPGLTQLGVALAELLVELAPLIVAFLEFQVTLLDKLLPVIGPLIGLLAKLVSAGLSAVSDFITRYVIPAVQALVALINGDFSGALALGKRIARNFAEDLARNFTSLRDRGGAAIRSLGQAVTRHVAEMAVAGLRGMVRMVADMVRTVASLPGRIRSALPNASQLLFGIGQSIIRGLINGIRSQIGALASQLRNITGMIPGWKGPAEKDARILTPAGRLLIGGLQRGIAEQLPALQRQLEGVTTSLPGMAMGPYGAGPGSPAAGGPQRVVIELRGPDAMRDLIRSIVQTDGRGDVQLAFGQL
ncbi:hypothetical protein ACH44C_33635 [Streptomyces purpureus]|uniref:hypothetical protein n=1 Tax=Streptomyces purpureus TaxID=1951 RepID=UPI0037BC45D3